MIDYEKARNIVFRRLSWADEIHVKPFDYDLQIGVRFRLGKVMQAVRMSLRTMVVEPVYKTRFGGFKFQWPVKIKWKTCTVQEAEWEYHSEEDIAMQAAESLDDWMRENVRNWKSAIKEYEARV